MDGVRRGVVGGDAAAAGHHRRAVVRAGQRLAAPDAHRAAGRAADTALLLVGVGALCSCSARAPPGSSPCTASRAARSRPPAGAAAGDADLHHRLLLRGAARLLRARAAPAAGAVRLAHGARLLVSRDAHASGRRHSGAVGRALPLRLPVGAGELRAAVGVRAGGGAHAGPHLAADLLGGGAAAGAAGAGGRRWRSP